MSKIDLQQGDCLKLMKQIKDQSIDFILCDLPYGTIKGLNIRGWTKTQNNWDQRLPSDKLFKEYERIIKFNAPIILFSQEPYTSELRTGKYNNINFSYPLIYEKNVFGNCLLTNIKPVNMFEDLSVFYKKYNYNNDLLNYAKSVMEYLTKNYNINSAYKLSHILHHHKLDHFLRFNSLQFTLPTKEAYQELIDKFNLQNMNNFLTYNQLQSFNRKRIFNNNNHAVKSIFKYSKDNDHYHPTQKPVALLEDLIKLYTNEGMTVLDNCMGSGSTGVACVNTNRDFIGMELNSKYFQIAKNRISQAQLDKQKGND